VDEPGTAAPGRRSAKVSIHDVARQARVSTATVSNVFNRPQVVAESTRLRVQAAVAAVGYVPDGAARVMRGAASSVVGCILLDVSNPFYAEVFRGIEDVLRPHGCLALIGSSDLDPEREREYLRLMRSQRVRGVILNPTTTGLADLIDGPGQDCPIVLIDHPQQGRDLCAVTADHERGGYLLAQHLLRLGHRTLTLVWPPIDVEGLRLRAAGARRACVDAGLDPTIAVHQATLERDAAGELLIEALVERLLPDRPTALMCFNDITAVRVLQHLQRLSVPVPQRISVTGYDDLTPSSLLAPGLTTVRQPAREVGLLAARLMLAENDPSHRHEELVVAVELMVRASTAAPAT
jgi:LacI family transcriptional regulator